MTHLNGWFGRVDTEQIIALVNRFSWMNEPLLWATIVIELGALALFAHRRWFAFIIIGTVALHGGIFLSSGICFWKWVLFNLGVWWMVSRSRESGLLFSRGFLVVSIATILTAPWHAKPHWLAWFDTPADEFTEFEVTTVSGANYAVERGFFEPHDLPFAQNRFYFLNDQPTALGTFGATTDADFDRALQAATRPAEADSIIQSHALVRFDESLKAEFENYLRLFFATLNERGSKELWISRLRAPHHIWNQRPEPVYRVQEPVAEVRAVYHRVWFDGTEVHELERRVLTAVQVPMTRSEALAMGVGPAGVRD
jgi:hypothetical protein